MTTKNKLTLEYVVPCSVPSLYNLISSSEGLSSWFADRVESLPDDFFDFYWGRYPQRAKLVCYKRDKFVRFVWEEDLESDYYFEISIDVTNLTKQVAIYVTDFCEEDAHDDMVAIWNDGIKKLRHRLGVRR